MNVHEKALAIMMASRKELIIEDAIILDGSSRAILIDSLDETIAAMVQYIASQKKLAKE